MLPLVSLSSAGGLDCTSVEVSTSNRGSTVRQLVGRPTGIQPISEHTATAAEISNIFFMT